MKNFFRDLFYLQNGQGTDKMQKKIRQAVILAGGYGTRLSPFTDHSPKPMYEFYGKPFLLYLIEQIKAFGIEDILILLGYLPDKIMDYFGDGEKYGVHLSYRVTPQEYETGARIKDAGELLAEDFLLMYCDNYCPVDFKKLWNSYYEKNAEIQITAYANRDGYTKSNLIVGDGGQVLCYDKTRKTPELAGVDIGYAIVSKKALRYLPEENCNFEAAVYPKLVRQGTMYAAETEHRYYSIGSWERIELTKQFFSPVKTIFLDRDGTLNVRPKKACYIEREEDFVWLEGAKEAVCMLKRAGCRLILITNQPGIARGNLSLETLERIHEKMQRELKEAGGGIDAVYYCPHNWDEGCLCRKPKPGMFFQAQKDFSLNLCDCIMIGDDERDMQAAMAAGCEGILVNEEYTLLFAARELLGREVWE